MKANLKNIILGVVLFSIGFYLGVLYGISNSTIKVEGTAYSDTISSYLLNKSIEFPVVAVTTEGEGVLNYATLTIIPGNGKELITLNPFVETDTQYSFETAVNVACKLAHINCKKYNFILEFKTNATLVGGPSAGAAMTLATYFLLINKTFPKDIVITGTISEDGSIGPVGGVFEKALAAAKAGKKYFFVPAGQSIAIRYEKVEKRRQIGPITYIEIYYKPVKFNLTKFFLENYGMRIIEVHNIKELIDYVNKIE